MTVKYSDRTGLLVVAGKGADVYEQMKSRDRYIDFMLNPVVAIHSNDPDDTFTKSSKYCLIGDNPAGAFSGKPGWLAIYHGTENGNSTAGWEFIEPFEGMRLLIPSETGKGLFESAQTDLSLTWKYLGGQWMPELGSRVNVKAIENNPDNATSASVYVVGENPLYEFYSHNAEFAFKRPLTNEWVFVKPWSGQEIVIENEVYDNGNLFTQYQTYKLVKNSVNNSWKHSDLKDVLIPAVPIGTTLDIKTDCFNNNFYDIFLGKDTTLNLINSTPSTGIHTYDVKLMLNPREFEVSFLQYVNWSGGVKPDFSKNSINFLTLTCISQPFSPNPLSWYGRLDSKSHLIVSFDLGTTTVDSGLMGSYTYDLGSYVADQFNYGFKIYPAENIDQTVTVICNDNNGLGLGFVRNTWDYRAWSNVAPFNNYVPNELGHRPYYDIFRDSDGVNDFIVIPWIGGSETGAEYSYDDGQTVSSKTIQQTTRSDSSGGAGGGTSTQAICFFKGGCLVLDMRTDSDNRHRYYRFFSSDIGDGDVENTSNALELTPTPKLIDQQSGQTHLISSESENYVFVLEASYYGSYPYSSRPMLYRFNKDTNKLTDLNVPDYYFNKNEAWQIQNPYDGVRVTFDRIFAVNDLTLLITSGWEDRSEGDIWDINECIWISYNGGYDWLNIDVSQQDVPIYKIKRFHYDKYRNSYYLVCYGPYSNLGITNVFITSDFKTFSEVTLPQLFTGEHFTMNFTINYNGILMCTNAGRVVMLNDFSDPKWPFIRIVNNFDDNDFQGVASFLFNEGTHGFFSAVGANLTFDTVNRPFGNMSLRFGNEDSWLVRLVASSAFYAVPSGNYTIEVFVNFDGYPGAYPIQSGQLKKYCIFSENYNNSSTNNANRQMLYFDENGRFGLYRGSYFGNTTWQIDELSSSTFTPGVWYYVKLVCDLGVIKLYVDNVLEIEYILDLESLPVGDKGWSAVGDFLLGASHITSDPNYNFYFKGNMKCFRITGDVRDDPIPIGIFPTN